MQFLLIGAYVMRGVSEEGLPNGLLLDLALLEVGDLVNGLKKGFLLDDLDVVSLLSVEISQLAEDVDEWIWDAILEVFVWIVLRNLH